MLIGYLESTPKTHGETLAVVITVPKKPTAR